MASQQVGNFEIFKSKIKKLDMLKKAAILLIC